MEMNKRHNGFPKRFVFWFDCKLSSPYYFIFAAL